MSNIWIMQPRTEVEWLGLIPGFFAPGDTRSAKEQIDEMYCHGGGWKPMGAGKWKMVAGGLSYPGDPVLLEIGRTTLASGETVIVYDYAMVAVVAKDVSFEVARMD